MHLIPIYLFHYLISSHLFLSHLGLPILKNLLFQLFQKETDTIRRGLILYLFIYFYYLFIELVVHLFFPSFS